MTQIRPLRPRYRDAATGLDKIRRALSVYDRPLPKAAADVLARIDAIDKALRSGPAAEDLAANIFNSDDVEQAVRDALRKAAGRATVRDLRSALEARANAERAAVIGRALAETIEALTGPLSKDLATIEKQTQALPRGDKILVSDAIVRLPGATGAFCETEPALNRVLAVTADLPWATCEPSGLLRPSVSELLYLVDVPDPGPLRFETLGRDPLSEPAERTNERLAANEFAEAATESQHVALARGARGDFVGHSVRVIESIDELMDRVAAQAASQAVVRGAAGKFPAGAHESHKRARRFAPPA